MKSIKPKDTWESEDRFGRNENEETNGEETKVIGSLGVKLKLKRKQIRSVERGMRKLYKAILRSNNALNRQIALCEKLESHTPIGIKVSTRKKR